MSGVDLTLAHWIRDRRHELGLTQTALGRKCGVPQPIVSRWEQGVRVPHDRHMASLRQVLGDPPANVPQNGRNGPGDMYLALKRMTHGVPRWLNQWHRGPRRV